MKVTPYSIKSLENKAYNTKEVTLIKTLFTENWPRQSIQIHHHSYITARTLRATSQVFKSTRVRRVREWRSWGTGPRPRGWTLRTETRSGGPPGFWERTKSMAGLETPTQLLLLSYSPKPNVSSTGLHFLLVIYRELDGNYESHHAPVASSLCWSPEVQESASVWQTARRTRRPLRGLNIN